MAWLLKQLADHDSLEIEVTELEHQGRFICCGTLASFDVKGAHLNFWDIPIESTMQAQIDTTLECMKELMSEDQETAIAASTSIDGNRTISFGTPNVAKQEVEKITAQVIGKLKELGFVDPKVEKVRPIADRLDAVLNRLEIQGDPRHQITEVFSALVEELSAKRGGRF